MVGKEALPSLVVLSDQSQAHLVPFLCLFTASLCAAGANQLSIGAKSSAGYLPGSTEGLGSRSSLTKLQKCLRVWHGLWTLVHQGQKQLIL